MNTENALEIIPEAKTRNSTNNEVDRLPAKSTEEANSTKETARDDEDEAKEAEENLKVLKKFKFQQKYLTKYFKDV